MGQKHSRQKAKAAERTVLQICDTLERESLLKIIRKLSDTISVQESNIDAKSTSTDDLQTGDECWNCLNNEITKSELAMEYLDSVLDEYQSYNREQTEQATRCSEAYCATISSISSVESHASSEDFAHKVQHPPCSVNPDGHNWEPKIGSPRRTSSPKAPIEPSGDSHIVLNRTFTIET